MKQYDKERFINNVYALIRKRGMKVGELEDLCKVSRGYLARLRQNSANTICNSNVAGTIAYYLNVTLDDLLYKDLTENGGFCKMAKLKRMVIETETAEFKIEGDEMTVYFLKSKDQTTMPLSDWYNFASELPDILVRLMAQPE